MSLSSNERAAMDAIMAEVGIDFRCYSGRKYLGLRYGYAWVHIPSEHIQAFGDGTLSKPIHMTGRKEGDPKKGSSSQYIATDNWGEAAAFVKDVLSTGRTIECGEGAGIMRLFRQTTARMRTVNYRLDRALKGLMEPDDIPPLDMDSDYQRGHVWTQEQREKYIGYFIESGAIRDIPQMPVVIYYPPDVMEAAQAQVVDGKQRLTSIKMWIEGDIAARLSSGREVWFKDLNEIERASLPHLAALEIEDDPEGFFDFYLRLNAGGTVHTEDEISRVGEVLDELD